MVDEARVVRTRLHAYHAAADGTELRTMRRSRIATTALVALLVLTIEAQAARKREREHTTAPPPAPPDRRDRLVSATGLPFDGRPYWQALAQCGGIYFKLNSLFSKEAIQTKVVKPDPAANAQFTKKSDAARRTATVYFEAAERFLIADRGMPRDDAMLTYDARATTEGDRYKSIEAAEQATRSCPALYEACRKTSPKMC